MPQSLQSRELLNLISRRELLTRSAAGFAGVALGALLAQDAARAEAESSGNSSLQPHFAPKAKAVIQLFQHANHGEKTISPRVP